MQPPAHLLIDLQQSEEGDYKSQATDSAMVFPCHFAGVFLDYYDGFLYLFIAILYLLVLVLFYVLIA